MGPSVQQLLIVLLIILVLFGAKKIPELAKGMGKGIKSFKKEMADDETNTQESEKISEVKSNTNEDIKNTNKEV